jgi:hypothetical protein
VATHHAIPRAEKIDRKRERESKEEEEVGKRRRTPPG